jgi:hypothetical protein
MGEARGTAAAYPPGQANEFNQRAITEIESLLGYTDHSDGDKENPQSLGWETEGGFVCLAGLLMRIAGHVVRQDSGLVNELMLHQFEACGQDQVLPITPDVFREYLRIGGRKLGLAQQRATEIGGQLCLAGVVPSIMPRDLIPSAMTPGNDRFSGLAYQLQAHLGDIHIQIGDIDLTTNNLCLAGVGNSEQSHIDLALHELVDWVNAAQMAASIIVAATAGSPVMFGQRVGAEGRIPAFTEAFRGLPTLGPCHRLPDGTTTWVQTPRQVLEYCLNFPPYMPELSDTPVSQASHWARYNGLNHPWVCPTRYPAIRKVGIEFRPMPAGPTLIDQAINHALFLALTAALTWRMGKWIAAGFPYHYAISNFDNATTLGLEALLFWPDSNGRPHLVQTRDIAIDLLKNDAIVALAALGVGIPTAKWILALASERIRTGNTAANWISQAAELDSGDSWEHSLALVTLLYMQRSDNGLTEDHPVHLWEPASNAELVHC